MADTDHGVGGGGGPLIVLQASVIPQWQGASDFENCLMNGGDVETDYDVICCDGEPPRGVFVLNRHGRDMLVLWMGAFGGRLLSPQSLSLSPNAIVLMQGYTDDDLSDVLPKIQERFQKGMPERSLLLNVQDTTLRFQAGADTLQVAAYGFESSYDHGYLDIPVLPGLRQCDVYEYDNYPFKDEIVVIDELKAD